MGIKLLEFKEDGPAVKLFDKEYYHYMKSEFENDFTKIIWFTYKKKFRELLKRKDFLKQISNDQRIEQVSSNNLQSDNGWGCMIRVSQMILARVLYCHKENNELRIFDGYFDQIREESEPSIWEAQKEVESENTLKRNVIKMFLDNACESRAPYSIQNYSEAGYLLYNKVPGEWYGSNSAAFILKHLNDQYKPERNLEIVVFDDLGIIEDTWRNAARVQCDCKSKTEALQIEKEFFIVDSTVDQPEESGSQHFCSNSNRYSWDECEYFENNFSISLLDWNQKFADSGSFECEESIDFNSKRSTSSDKSWVKSLFIIQCVRLGMEDVPEQYFKLIKSVFDIPQCVGIMGGKERKALYFVGHEGNNLIFLDPHYVHDAMKIKDANSNFNLKNYTCSTPKKLPMTSLDPWLAFGYYIKDESDYIQFKQEVTKRVKMNEDFKCICNIRDLPIKPY